LNARRSTTARGDDDYKEGRRLEIIAKLATVLECEPAELLRVPAAPEGQSHQIARLGSATYQ
jgi:hypothetical protein